MRLTVSKEGARGLMFAYLEHVPEGDAVLAEETLFHVYRTTKNIYGERVVYTRAVFCVHIARRTP